jgi:hypothetical protein
MSHAHLITVEERLRYTFNPAGLMYVGFSLLIPLLFLMGGVSWQAVAFWAVLLPSVAVFVRFATSTEMLVDSKFPQVRCTACGQMHRPDPS